MRFMEVDQKHLKHHKEKTTLPVRSTKKSAGYDFFLKEDVELFEGIPELTFTDVKCELADDEVLMIYPRSSLAMKKGIVLANGTGVIDADYFSNEDNDGNIGLPLLNSKRGIEVLKKGERVAQGIVMKYVVADDDSAGEIRSGGFGSTGN